MREPRSPARLRHSGCTGRGMSARILIVDDDEPITFAIQTYFAARGGRVSCAAALDEAQALVDAHEFDVVIADLRLSGSHSVEGLELITYVRARGSSKVILLTACGSEEIARAAIDRGAHAVLQKPTPLSRLASVVSMLLAGADIGSNPAATNGSVRFEAVK